MLSSRYKGAHDLSTSCGAKPVGPTHSHSHTSSYSTKTWRHLHMLTHLSAPIHENTNTLHTYGIAWLRRDGAVAVFADFTIVLDPLGVGIVWAAVASHLLQSHRGRHTIHVGCCFLTFQSKFSCLATNEISLNCVNRMKSITNCRSFFWKPCMFQMEAWWWIRHEIKFLRPSWTWPPSHWFTVSTSRAANQGSYSNSVSIWRLNKPRQMLIRLNPASAHAFHCVVSPEHWANRFSQAPLAPIGAFMEQGQWANRSGQQSQKVRSHEKTLERSDQGTVHMIPFEWSALLRLVASDTRRVSQTVSIFHQWGLRSAICSLSKQILLIVRACKVSWAVCVNDHRLYLMLLADNHENKRNSSWLHCTKQKNSSDWSYLCF